MILCDNMNTNLDNLTKVIPLNDSFDITVRNAQIYAKNAFVICIPGLVNSDLFSRIIQHLENTHILARKKYTIENIQQNIPADTKTANDIHVLADSVLSGLCLLLIEDSSTAILVDIRQYPTRAVQEPTTEKVTHGSHDGFIETLVSNTSLIRRRIKN